MDPRGVQRILSALPPDRLDLFQLSFDLDTRKNDSLMESTGDEVPGISLERFAKLRKVSVYCPKADDLSTLRSIFRSWKPIQLPERRLSLCLLWDDLRKSIALSEEHRIGRTLTAVVEEACASALRVIAPA